MNLLTYAGSNELKGVDFCFSGGTLSSVSLGSSDANFSNNEEPLLGGTPVCFSLVDYLLEKKLPVRQAFTRRVGYVIRYINSVALEKVAQNRKFLIQYLNEFLQSVIFQYMKDNIRSNSVNLMIMLGVRPYISNPQLVASLQRELRLIEIQKERDGFVRNDYEKSIAKLYSEFFSDLLSTIIRKHVTDPEKQSIFLTSSNNGLPQIN